MSSTSKRRWSVGQEPAWLSSPHDRPLVGWNLLGRATSLQIGSGEASNCPYRMDTWSSPFTVAYLNVGRRHLVGSLGEVVRIVLAHRTDILFLGDLVPSRSHFGHDALFNLETHHAHYEELSITQPFSHWRPTGSECLAALNASCKGLLHLVPHAQPELKYPQCSLSLSCEVIVGPQNHSCYAHPKCFRNGT
jgi:hypothetical protein